MANQEIPENFDFLVKNWSELLKDIPTANLDRSFKLAFKTNRKYKIPTFYQVLDAADEIRNSTIKSGPATQEDEQYRGLKDSDFPTPEQHRLAIRCINAVACGTMDAKEGHGWLEKIFAGKVRDPKTGLES